MNVIGHTQNLVFPRLRNAKIALAAMTRAIASDSHPLKGTAVDAPLNATIKVWLDCAGAPVGSSATRTPAANGPTLPANRFVLIWSDGMRDPGVVDEARILRVVALRGKPTDG